MTTTESALPDDALASVPAEPVTRLRRFGPIALIALMLALALTLALGFVDFARAPVADPHLTLFVLAACWAAFELVVLYLQFGKDLDNAEHITVTEVVVALGLLFATPGDLLIVGIVTPLLIDLVRSRKSAIKQIFNSTNRAVEMAVALAVYQALNPADPLSLQGWGALTLAVIASSLVSAFDVAVVISLSIGRLPGRDFLRDVLSAGPVSIASTTLAFISGLALQSGPSAVAPLLVGLGVLLALMRGFSLLTDRHMNLASLHSLGRRLAAVQDVDAILASTLDTVAELLIAREVEVYLPVAGDPSHLLRVRRGPDGALTQTVVERDRLPDHRGLLGKSGTVVAAAPLDAGHEVVLSVAGRAEPMRRFNSSDARLLDMVAHQTGPNLHTAQLIAGSASMRCTTH